MSDAAQTSSTESNTNAPSTSQAPRGLWTSGLRIEAADGVPPEYVGKTASEIVQMAETYRSAMNAPPQYQQQSYQQPPQQAAFSSQDLAPPDPQLLYSNPQLYQQQQQQWMQHQVDQRVGQYAAPLLQNQANTAKWQSRNDPEYADVWAKYGHEIEAMATRVQPHLLTLEAYNTFADVVRGKHWKDFVENRAQQLAASGGFGTERAAPGGAPPTQQLSALDRLFSPTSDHPQSRRYRDNNTSKADFLRYCAAMGKDPEAHANDILGGGVLAA